MADDDHGTPESNARAAAEPEDQPEGLELVGTVVAERYRVEQLLGVGAMGAVYRAEHIHMRKAVALKVLHHAMSQNPEVVRRFEREAVAAGRIEHPHVAGATDFGRLADGSFYLVLEFIDGKNLGQLMEEVGAMPAERVCRIAAQIAAALSAAHAAGIVHRDLKPENVMMPRTDSEVGDIVKVLDFGMAKLGATDSTQTKLTVHGAVYGTPQYMAPEQAAGQEVDARADLYALGVMLYEMLSGRPPFEAPTMMAVLVKHMTETPAPLPGSVPESLQRLVMRCLEKQPADRPASADEVLEMLSEILGAGYGAPRLSQVLAVPAFGRTEHAVRPLTPVLRALQTNVQLGKWVFPRWIPAVVLLGSFALAWGLSASDESAPSSTQGEGVPGSSIGPQRSGDERSPDPALAKVIQAAALGSEPALYALEQRDADDRSLEEWLGLTKARLMNKKVNEGLDSFASAIKMDESAASDQVILGALRRLTDHEEYAAPIIEFAADNLGSTGADLLFHIWAKTSLKTTATLLAFEKLSSSQVKEKASPALRVAMKLRDAERCEDYLEQFPDIERHGDDRTLTRLRPLLKQRGCGPTERDDCYPCLRKGDALESAMQAAGMRKSPQFELRDFRFKR